MVCLNEKGSYGVPQCPTKVVVEGNILTHYVVPRLVYHDYNYLLGFIHSKKTGPVDPYRGEKVVITVSGGPIVVVNCGGNSMGNGW